VTFAARRIFIQLMIAPHRWEKTEHGGARTSLRIRLRLREPTAPAVSRRPPRRAVSF
jgi:hypothetical protein